MNEGVYHMHMKIAIFLLLLAAFLAIFNISIPSVLGKNLRYNRKKTIAINRIGYFPDNVAVPKRILSLARYKLKLSSVLKYSAFEAGADGLLRLKLLLGILGFVLGILIKNPFLAVVLLAGFFWLPDAYFHITSLRYAKEADEAVESAMGLVTNSYLQNEDIKSSIIENIARIDPPLREIFREFLAETGFVDANVQNALHRMKLKTDNAYFSDWCDILVQCQDDRELKYVLPSIVSKLNSVKKLQIELDNVMYDIYKEFLYVAGIVILNLPLMFLINAEWAGILFGTPIGKLTVAISFTIVFIASAYVVSVNRSLVRMNAK